MSYEDLSLVVKGVVALAVGGVATYVALRGTKRSLEEREEDPSSVAEETRRKRLARFQQKSPSSSCQEDETESPAEKRALKPPVVAINKEIEKSVSASSSFNSLPHHAVKNANISTDEISSNTKSSEYSPVKKRKTQVPPCLISSSDEEPQAIAQTSVLKNKEGSPKKVKALLSPKQKIAKFMMYLLQAERLTLHVEKVKIVHTPLSDSCELSEGSLKICFHCSNEILESTSGDIVFTLPIYLRKLNLPSENSLAECILRTCLPSSAAQDHIEKRFESLKKQVVWLAKVFLRCDPLSKFYRDISRLIEDDTCGANSSVTNDANNYAEDILRIFRSACVSLGKKLLKKCGENLLTKEISGISDDELPPLFADDIADIQPEKRGPYQNLSSILNDMMCHNVLPASFFNEIIVDSPLILRDIFAMALHEIKAAVSGNSNIFQQLNCNLLGSFPDSSLDVLYNTAPVLGNILVENILECNALRDNDSKVYDGIDLMNSFFLTELLCITRALELPHYISSKSLLAAESWTKLILSKTGELHARLDDIDRIIQRVRDVTFELFKSIVTLQKGRYKRDVMNFFLLVLDLIAKRTLGRNDDPDEAIRGFEPESRVLSRHFLFGVNDLVLQLVSRGGTVVFNYSFFLDKRDRELVDTNVVKSLFSGEYCKCNFDVFLFFFCNLLSSAQHREYLRHNYIMEGMRKDLSRIFMVNDQKEDFENFMDAYHMSFCCQMSRSTSLDDMGRSADLFCQYLLKLVDTPSAGNFFAYLQQSPHNIFNGLSFCWLRLCRIRRPSADQIVFAERVVFLICKLLNTEDLIADVKQQSYLVSILSSICGNIANLNFDQNEFRDECLSKGEITSGNEFSGDDFSSEKNKWPRNLKQTSNEKSAYFGSRRGPYVGAIFDSERNVRDIPVALAKLYISCQSVEDWDADRDISFSKFSLREKIGDLLVACFHHPLHSEAVINALSTSDSLYPALVVVLFESAIDHSASNLAFLVKSIEIAKGKDEIARDYYSVRFVRQGMQLLRELCMSNTILFSHTIKKKLGNQIIEMSRVADMIRQSDVVLGLTGTRKYLMHFIHSVTHQMENLGGQDLLDVVVDCCIEKGIRLEIEDDSTMLSSMVAKRWEIEDEIRNQQQGTLYEYGDSDDYSVLNEEVQNALCDNEFVVQYQNALGEICNVVESVTSIPGFKFEKIAKESNNRGSSRRLSVMKAWKQVRKCLRNADGSESFHPNGTIVVKYLDSDASCARAALTVGADTPYAFGVFFFDIWLPPDYPFIPPLCELITTGGGSIMLSPNLYTCGKVCMSLLNTAQSGSDIEKWQPDESTVAQVLLTIQSSLLGDSEPMTKEGKRRGSKLSLAYNEEKHFETVQWGMIDCLVNSRKNMGEEFSSFVFCHFSHLRKQIRLKVRSWWLIGRRNERIERVFIALLSEFNKLQRPSPSTSS